MDGYGLTTLFLDLNSFFASVEQQERPELRGRPVGVIPVEAEGTSCIAASYEARAFGVKTGTSVNDARRLCPGIRLVCARPRVYLEYHHRVLDAVGECVRVRRVCSIDEVACDLPLSMRTPERVEELGRLVKREVLARVGECMKSSVGVAPNGLLAKLAADMQKPDGLTVLTLADLPSKILHLPIEDIPGIGPRMGPRLRARGVGTMEALYAQSEAQMSAHWGGIVGRRMWMWLRGREVELPGVVHRTIGHQHVLPPALRSDEGARAVVLRMLTKAMLRARHQGYAPSRLTIGVRYEGAYDMPVRRWSAWTPLGDASADLVNAVTAATALWATRDPGTPKQVSVTLSDLVALSSATRPLFEEERKGSDLTHAMHLINTKHGRNTLYPASVHTARDAAPGGIAFHCVPDRTFHDSLAGDEARTRR